MAEEESTEAAADDAGTKLEDKGALLGESAGLLAETATLLAGADKKLAEGTALEATRAELTAGAALERVAKRTAQTIAMLSLRPDIAWNVASVERSSG